MRTECSLEARVPDISWLPVRRCDGRADEVVRIREAVDSRHGIDHRLKLVEIILRPVGGWTVPVSSVEIRFVPYLKAKDVASKDPLALSDNLQSQV